MKERSVVERDKVLAGKKWPENRKCPNCGEIKIQSQQWVGYICRSCWQVDDGDTSVFLVLINRYELDGAKLEKERGDITITELAARCGWTRQYQQQLENIVINVSEDVQDTIVQAMEELEKTTDCFSTIHRYAINGAALKGYRLSRSLSNRCISRKCGWSSQYQSQLEAGKYGTVSFETGTKLLQALGCV